MKKMRKGFTLIELLIVIVIIGILAATMGLSMRKATAQAKATAIVSNIAACKDAAAMYYADNLNKTLSDKTAGEFLKSGSEYIPSWDDFAGELGVEGTQYMSGSGQGYEKWDLEVDFSQDGDAIGIATALGKIRGYTDITTDAGGFTIELSTGTITSVQK